MVQTAWIYEFIPSNSNSGSPQLHQYLHLQSTCHLHKKTYLLTPDLHWHQYLHIASCTGYWIHATYTNKCLHHFVHATLYTFPVCPLLTTSTLYIIIMNASTTDTTWPPYSLLHYLLPFPTNHNVGFIYIYSHASILHIIIFKQYRFRPDILPIIQTTASKHWQKYS